ncbi:LacI family DNA-binding transcriptional regulator, partial [Candidatus Gracilibacteria bacterium]|nr:LacI family DNA-binding transcriptional regulator [Candidatus Gracilibacteria bacterium]
SELDYHPSAVARRLQGRRSEVIAYVTEVGGQPVNDFQFKDFITVLARSCAEHQLDLLIHPLRSGGDYRTDLSRLLRGGHVDGLILADTRAEDARVNYLIEQGLPFVAFGRTNRNDNYAFVDLDSQAGTYASTMHLIERGHRRIAFLGTSLTFAYAQYRLDGYNQALRTYDQPLDPALIFADLDNESQTREAVRQLLSLPEPPSAITAATDMLALHAMRALEDAGIQPGRDIALVGFDDIPLAAYARPALTTVRQPFDLIGGLLIRTLLGVIAGASEIQHQHLVQPTLVVRESSCM